MISKFCSSYNIKMSVTRASFLTIDVSGCLSHPIWSNDISGKSYVQEMYEGCVTKKWIKQIPLDKTVPWDEYTRRDYFKHVANIVYDDTKNRVVFVPQIEKEEYERKSEWIYTLTVNDRLVKIGGTRDGLKGRISSYCCGIHVVENGKSGKASVTNSYIYNTFEFYLKLGCKIDMYGYELPVVNLPPINIIDRENVIIRAQTYPAYETIFMEDFTNLYGFQPFLSNNCDSKYKEEKKKVKGERTKKNKKDQEVKEDV